MTDTNAEQGNQARVAERENLSVSDKVRRKYDYGPYRVCIPGPDQASWERIRASLTITRDIQSDAISVPPRELPSGAVRDVFDALKQHLKTQLIRDWESEESSTDEEPTKPAAVESPARSRDSDTTPVDVSQWPSAQLASEILQPQAESNMPALREMILTAEDTGFAPDQSGRLAPWLLSFAERHRDSSDPQDEAAVWSAIRTGASMLTQDAADRLRPLLQPGHSIETSLVAVKMLGRIFEAQPPADVDQHIDLSGDVR